MNLKADLEALGSTEQEVAATLKAKGIRGLRDYSWGCPVANYLKSLGYQVEMVLDDHVCADIVDGCLFKRFNACTPPAIKAFILAFDRRDYPELDWSLAL